MRYRVIAIEREYASGGHEIGEKLAERLGIACHGHDIAAYAGKELGLTEAELAEMEERVTGSLLYSIAVFADAASGRGGQLPKPEKLAITESGIVREMAKEPCVIIGRGAAGLLKDDPNVFRAFFYADEPSKQRRATEVYGIEAAKAQSVMQKTDRRRANYYRFASGADWKAPTTYDLCLNSGRLGIDRAVEILLSAVI